MSNYAIPWPDLMRDLGASILRGRVARSRRRYRSGPPLWWPAEEPARPPEPVLPLDAIYAEPHGLEHEGDWLRLTHADLAGMDDGTLRAERDRLRLRLMLDARPGPWLLERLAALDAERKGRSA